MNSITVCVGYSDLLAITLPRNARHFARTLVVTSREDARTVALVESLPDFPRRIQYFKTDAFTRHGATFNKGLAIEEAFDVVGRHNWICVWDADTLLPSFPLKIGLPNKEFLYSAARRILHDPKQWSPALDWDTVPVIPESRPTTFPGYFHLFHADAQALKRSKRFEEEEMAYPGECVLDGYTPPREFVDDLPWYDVTFKHAGGGDGFFQSRWPKDRKVRLPDPVMHLGPRDTNWFGTTDWARDQMIRYRIAKGWVRGVQSDPTYQERVSVPGHEPRNWVYAPGE